MVDNVKSYLEEIGFIATKFDDEIDKGKPKKEDLRLTMVNDPSWEGIVEIRGYTKSSGSNSDILRLNRFAELYNKEKGKFPSKRIYIVNGQTDLSPFKRQLPLESAEEDICIFAEQDGLIIDTRELFKVIRNINTLDKVKIKESIMSNSGMWKYIN